MTNTSSSTLRRILAAPWHQRRNAGGVWMLLLIVALCCSASVGLFAWSLFMNAELAAGMRHSAAVSGRVAVVTLLVAWWAVMVSNVLEQNHPTFARLVPHHAAQLRLALVAAGAALVALVSLVLCLDVPDLLACAVWAALGVALLAASMRWPLLWIPACGLPYTAVAVSHSPALSDAVDFVLREWHEQRLAIAVTCFAAAVVALVALIQDGGPRHAANYAARRDRLVRMQAAMRGEQALRPSQRGSLAWLLHSPYHAWLRHVLASPRGSVHARLLLGLGPAVHWTTAPIAFTITALGILAGVVLLELAALMFPSLGGYVPVILSSVSIGVMFGLMSPPMQMQSRLHQTRREQALLALLPGVPRRAALNRWLGWQLSAQFFLAWFGGLALMGLCALLAMHLGRPAVELSYGEARALMALATLPLLTWQWRRWARLSPPTPLNAGMPTLMGMGLAALAFAGQATGRLTLVEAGIAFALPALAWCALRWRRMGDEPNAFPVGRLA